MIGVWLLALALALLTAAPAGARPGATLDTTGRVEHHLDTLEGPLVVQPRAAYGTLPLHFEANRGQTDLQVKFLSRGPDHTLFLTRTEAVLVLTRAQSRDKSGQQSLTGKAEEHGTVTRSVLRTSFVGANHDPKVSGQDELPGKANYLIGNDPAKWRTGMPTYARVRYQALYPGIDLVYYGNQRQLEYDFVVAPGAHPQAITLAFEGADELEVDARGDLVLHTAAGALRHRKPVIYQEIDGVRREIPGGYVSKGRHHVGFQVAAYDVERPLIIDPTLVFSTYLGGSSFESALGIAIDGAGNAYVVGGTQSADFPTTPGALLTTLNGGFDAFVAKLDPTGSALVYATYLGGNNIDQSSGIAVDGAGNAYVSGSTQSRDFPTTPGAFQTTSNGDFDAFVAKLDPTGSALIYATYLGGNNIDQSGGIAVDGAGNAYVSGSTQSTNFPTTPGAFQATFKGGFGDAFVTKLDPTGSTLVYSTYLGGSDSDRGSGIAGSSIAIDGAGNAYVSGGTQSTDFPTTPGAFQTTFNGGSDAFVAKLNSTGSALVYSTYLGGSDFDEGGAIVVDALGNAYVTGATFSANFPTTLGAFDTTFNGGDAFVTKLNSTGSALAYSTYLGGSAFDAARGIAIDSAGYAYVVGVTQSTDFPTTPGAVQMMFNGGLDAFVTTLDPTGSALVHATYLGGSASDEGSRIAVDTAGNAYVGGQTGSADFPTTAGAFDTTLNGFNDAFAAKIAAFVAFATFSAEVEIKLGPLADDDKLEVKGTLTLGAGSNGIDPTMETVSLKVGTYARSIPSGCFTQPQPGLFKCEEPGGLVEVVVQDRGNGAYAFNWEDKGADATGTSNPVDVILVIGDDRGMTTAQAEIEGP
jgi:hypothetical protein